MPDAGTGLVDLHGGGADEPDGHESHIVTGERRESSTRSASSVALNTIERFIAGWNDRCQPFVWTKTADELLDHCRPGQRASFTRH